MLFFKSRAFHSIPNQYTTTLEMSIALNRVILAPVARTALVAAWAVTFVFCLRDVALPLFLAPPGRDTLTARTMTLMANGSPELIAALCLLAVLVALVPLGALGVAWRAWSKPV